ncbi:hypothetical protein [Brevundimonas lenta]|uniref:Porin domain-containing protein n=1 Tax=Brevundimonas lenta TaxID=424796 RepID=A0A7W6JCD8_9CAUL|nr:hypothetical protein [Brevundimonas lenta]MBB4082551.1 hypothetical protein [Brevundimonas lenta]
MKSLFLATAAVAAFAAAPALAQDAAVGSVGSSYTYSEADVAGFSGDADSIVVDASFAAPVTADWTVSFDGGITINLGDEPGTDDSSLNGRVHVSRTFGDVRVATFAGAADGGEANLWSFGAQAQTYIDNITLTGGFAYETPEGVDADIWSLNVDGAYYVSPTLRLNAGAGWTTAEMGGLDTDAWTANVGGEYQIANTPFSITGGYTHAELEDLDLQIDTLNVGLRYTFGTDLQSRERAGADLGRTVAGIGGLASVF